MADTNATTTTNTTPAPSTSPSTSPFLEKWTTFGPHKEGSAGRQRIQVLLDIADLETLSQEALAVRRQCVDPSLDPSIACSVDKTNFSSGYSHVVLQVKFSDGMSWAARLLHREAFADEQSMEEEKTSLLSEMATMKVVRERTNVPVPEVFAFDMSPGNPVGYPWVLMGWVEGKALRQNLARGVPAGEKRDKVASQIADVLNELHSLRFEGLGRVWGGHDALGVGVATHGLGDGGGVDDGSGEQGQQYTVIPPAEGGKKAEVGRTSWEHFYRSRQRQNRRILKGNRGKGNAADWRTAAWILKTSISHIIVEDWHKGPFPLMHPTFHHGNILFNDEFDIVGVIGWSGAHTVPVERLATSTTELVAPVGVPEASAKATAEFRQLVMKALVKKEEEEEEEGGNLGKKFRLSFYMAGKRGELAARYSQANARNAVFVARSMAKLVFEEKITWEQLRGVYGHLGDFYLR
ncbi:hypothetical protein MKZ38_006192 [Zalerion maritima]|uniref:Aminoglycoside phosphotransferase domain-containing protein n=1 Tax=Zalerion maritima TaxID=339359 RepID=A0AAD5RJ59_9PEZI|nr:hypothetical protein MKZ38_006192 [Zalerion maritima]